MLYSVEILCSRRESDEPTLHGLDDDIFIFVNKNEATALFQYHLDQKISKMYEALKWTKNTRIPIQDLWFFDLKMRAFGRKI